MVNGSASTLLPTVTCLGVIVDQEMFADHVRRLASLWKMANVVPVPKVNPPSLIAADLRPLSLTRSVKY